MHWLLDAWIGTQTWLFETFVSPVLFHFNLMEWFDDAFDAVEFFMLGVVQILVIALLMRPLEKRRPMENVKNRRLPAVDRVYTVLSKLGVVPLVVFVIAYPITNEIELQMRGLGIAPPRIESLMPWLHDHPLVTFLIYFALYDFAAYWIHRAQHGFSWWWALHSLHHSQREVTAWTDDRNHVLDSLLVTLVLVIFSQSVGVQPGDYVSILMVGRLIESWSHANVDLGFGRIGDRLLVGPRFHRLHHALGTPAEPRIYDHNYALVFPLWDMLFGTARYDRKARPMGVEDPAIDADNDLGWLGQQVAGFRRFAAAILPRLAG
ncbi:Sterol desaturase/sphingolipid hydroxylase, fatty acid hydroxylase superfamily [Enhydrobacter aerosaccus]|uniref:Sterol desaturase/sphingolipid hydroxylase, fatty acid hydroxylase superfamily n=1 Tax=Enhydrobacter aerosaccus TaxID=225324 RepID=A0A1T4MTE4_9HYPH|nr:sterol desaturase family protein [Enhydrobacter aerosaccus]SJZ69908.1 Sterol desaturase/sphingolipid hydroxylase, fatty acid hydroxylase superfamily [Enhydrobacter aerosaccus]